MLARTDQLHRQGRISEREYQSAKADAQRLRAAGESQTLAIERYALQLPHDSDRGTRGKSLESDIARLESQLRSQLKPTNKSWRADKTYIRVNVHGWQSSI